MKLPVLRIGQEPGHDSLSNHHYLKDSSAWWLKLLQFCSENCQENKCPLLTVPGAYAWLGMVSEPLSHPQSMEKTYYLRTGCKA